MYQSIASVIIPPGKFSKIIKSCPPPGQSFVSTPRSQASLGPLILQNFTYFHRAQDLNHSIYPLNIYKFVGEHRFINEKYVKSGDGDNSEFFGRTIPNAILPFSCSSHHDSLRSSRNFENLSITKNFRVPSFCTIHKNSEFF